MQAIIGRKIDQTQKFLEDGTRIPVTVLSVLDNTVVAVKTAERDKYSAVQLGYGDRKKATKPLLGHAKKANLDHASLRLSEIRIQPDDNITFTKGDKIKAIDTFKAGDIIQVTGFSKGKGFAGGVKRYGFRGGPRTHGQSDRERAPGSIGQTTTPGRVYKGKKMAGRMGSEKVTLKNLQVVLVDDENKTLLIKGLVPGTTGSFVVVRKTGEVAGKKFVPMLSDKKVEPAESVEQSAESIAEEGNEPKEEIVQVEAESVAEKVDEVEKIEVVGSDKAEEASNQKPEEPQPKADRPMDEKEEDK